jgi:hypothetical protein
MRSLTDFDPSKHFLGDLCKYNHEFKQTGKSVRYINKKVCVVCSQERAAKRHERKTPIPVNVCPVNIVRDFDDTKYFLGVLCSRGHDYKGTGLSIRRSAGSCIACDKIVNKSYYEDNKDAILKHQKNYVENNSDAVKKRDADYYKRNCEKIKSRSSDWRRNNPEQKYKNDLKWAEENPEKVHESRRNWRHTNRGIQKEKDVRRRVRLVSQSDNTITKESIGLLYSSAKDCPYCGVEMSDRCHEDLKTAKSLDHLVPLEKGGSHSLSNVTICCLSCNSKKGNLHYHDWIERLGEPYRTNAKKIYTFLFDVRNKQC